MIPVNTRYICIYICVYIYIVAMEKRPFKTCISNLKHGYFSICHFPVSLPKTRTGPGAWAARTTRGEKTAGPCHVEDLDIAGNS